MSGIIHKTSHMYQISLKNNKFFQCNKDTTILNAAKKAGIVLEHSCLSARCRSCVVKVLEGDSNEVQEELVLSDEEKEQGYILSCNTKPCSDIKLDIEDLGDIVLYEPRTLPSKIDSIEKITNDVIKVVLRLPPTSNFKYIAGQYVNIIKGNIKRSYSIANSGRIENKVEFYIKKYKNGLLSNYWFSEAKENDLLRLEGPLGTFFYRKSKLKDIIFLATGTGIAPVKAILEQFNQTPELFANKKIWLVWGGRFLKDIFWNPNIENIDLKFLPVLSRLNNDWKGEIGYVQDVVLKQKINLEKVQVYACGSINMITSAKELLIKNGLPTNHFHSDAFVSSN